MYPDPTSEYELPGFWLVDVLPFPKSHDHFVGEPVDLSVKLTVEPAQELSFEKVNLAVGTGFTVTETATAELVHPETVTLQEYDPALLELAPVTVGFCDEEVKPFGPVQAYDALLTELEVNFIVAPAHIGLLLDTVDADGMGFTVITTESVAPHLGLFAESIK